MAFRKYDMGKTRKSFREKRQKVEVFWKSVLHQYCENTSLHGFRYLVSRDTSVIEKFVWLLICIFGFCFGIVMMSVVWQKFTGSPTVTNIESTAHSIFSVQFPAVSICNYNKVYKPHAEEFSEKLRQNGLSDEEITSFLYSLPRLIRPHYVDGNFTRVLEYLNSSHETIEDVMLKMMQPCDKLLLRCQWEGQSYDCNRMFRTIRSIEGFCCSFNYHGENFTDFSLTDDTVENKTGISSLIHNIHGPGMGEVLNVSGAGRDVGLSVVLNVDKEYYYGSIKPSFGASILIHNAFNYPEVDLLTSFVQPAQETAVILSASIVESDPDVRRLSLTQRSCWFDDEPHLHLTTKYSYQSCITECRMKFIKRYCHCVPFYYPNYRTLSGLRSKLDLAIENDTDTDQTCQCYPSCEEYTYTSNSENQFMEDVHFHLPILEGFNITNVSLASVYFRGITCLKYRKDAHISWDNVIASFGGIFGLCIGGSIVSLIEFLYYFTHKMMNKQEPENTEPPLAREVFKVASVENLSDYACQRLGNEILQRNQKVGQGKTKDGKHVTMKPDLEGEFIKYFVKDTSE